MTRSCTIPKSNRSIWLARRSSTFGNPATNKYGRIRKVNSSSMRWPNGSPLGCSRSRSSIVTWHLSAGLAAAQREGFERVLSLVALGEVELSAAGKDHGYPEPTKTGVGCWKVAQIFGTLIADEQQVDQLNNLDDQLVLGIKRALSVVELKVIRQRLLAGQEAKARRGGTLQKASDWVCPRPRG